jgi:hypothetical protein
MRRIALATLLVFACISATAQQSEIDELKTEVKSLTEQLSRVQARLDAIEAKTSPGRAEPSSVLSQATPSPTQNETKRPVEKEIRDRDVLTHDLSAAPRVDNIPIEKSNEGYINLPGNTRLQIAGYARLDLIHDFKPAGYPTAFIPSTIPVGPTVGANSTAVDINASRLSLDLRRPTDLGELRIFYENDFFGGNTQEPVYNLRHLYGQLHNVLVGYTYSAFLDVDTDPDTLDYQGPNGNTWAAAAQVRYTQPFARGQSLSFAVEGPLLDIQTDVAGPVPTSRTPDFTLKYRFDAEKGHLQLSSVFRDLGGYANTEAHVFGWGLTLAGAHSVGERDSFMADANYGHGIGHYLVDLFGLGVDAGFNAQGQLVAIPGFGAYAAYQHYWNKQWRSTATYGYARLANVYSLPPEAFHISNYAAGNVIWNVRDLISVGAELLYGTNLVKSGASGNATRLQLGIQYNFFPVHN